MVQRSFVRPRFRALPALLATATLLSACAQAPALPELSDTRWQGDGHPPTQLRLDASGQASGFGGCNRFSGRWRIEGGQLRLGPLATTRMMCLTPGGEQEGPFLASLEATRSARLEGGRLLLLDAQGQVLQTLQPAP
ncbi:MAG: META domain-containing protein [Curvibacter sp.]|nr:MAG: META domain-containing protein [Curvibacter sp.]